MKTKIGITYVDGEPRDKEGNEYLQVNLITPNQDVERYLIAEEDREMDPNKPLIRGAYKIGKNNVGYRTTDKSTLAKLVMQMSKDEENLIIDLVSSRE